MKPYLQIRSAVGATVPVEQIRAEVQTLTQETLATCRTPGEVPKVVRALAADVDRRLAEVQKRFTIQVACGAGCSFCCHGFVTTRASEIFWTAEWLPQRLSQAEVGKVIERARERHQQIQTRSTAAAQASLRWPCPLLVDHRCSAYEGRPLVCRTHHSMSVEPCRNWYEHPEDPHFEDHQHQTIFLTGEAARAGAAAGFEALGLDSTDYDFGSALYEALTDPRCARRWRDGKKAFSARCVALEPQPKLLR